MTFLTPLLAGIAAAIAIPALVILYFLKLRRRDVEVSTTLLWKKSIQDLQANAPFQRLRRNILLLLQMLVLLAVLGALAQPMLQRQRIEGSRHIILIDRSASMASTDETLDSRTATRLDAAKRQALDLIDSLRAGDILLGGGEGDEAMVVAFDTDAEPLQPFSRDRAALRTAVERIEQTDKPSAVDQPDRVEGIVQALRVALANLPTRVRIDDRTGKEQTIEGFFAGEPVTIHVFSDGRLPGQLNANPGVENTVVYHRVGKGDAANLAITALKAERSFQTPSQVTLFANLSSTDRQPRTVDVELLVDGAVRRIESATIPPAAADDLAAGSANIRAGAAQTREGQLTNVQTPEAEQAAQAARGVLQPGTMGVTFTIDNPRAMLVQVRLRDPSTGEAPSSNALPTDDRAWIAVPPSQRLRVAVVNASTFFIRDALAGLDPARLDELTTSQFEQMAAQGTAQYDVVVLDKIIPNLGQQVLTAPAPATVPATPATPASPDAGQGTATAAGVRRALPPGHFVVLGVVPDGLGLTDLGSAGQAGIIDWSREDPVTRYLVMDNVVLANARRVRIEPGSPAQVLASAEPGPAILRVTRNDTQAIIVPSDYMDSNWPFDLSFPTFIAQAVRSMGEELMGRLDARALTPGGQLVDRLPPGAERVRLRDPQGRETPIVPAPDGSINQPLGPSVGVYELTWDGPAGPGDVRQGGEGVGGRVLRVYAANLLNLPESDVPAASVLELANKQVAGAGTASAGAATGGAPRADRRIWPYLLALALLVVLVEWYIFNRKVQV